MPGARFLGVGASGAWAGPSSMVVDGRSVSIVCCASVLAFRQAMVDPPAQGAPLVLLTDRPGSELGADALARLAKGRLLEVDRWALVRDLFSASSLDPRLAEPWMPAVLVEMAPPCGFAPVQGGTLDAETAWGTVLAGRLRLAGPRPDARTLLRWTVDPDGVAAYRSAPPAMRESIARWIEESGGRLARLVLRAVDLGHAADVVPLGLACRVVFGAGPSGERVHGEAAVRLEPLVGGEALDPAVARTWAGLAEELVRERLAKDGLRSVAGVIERGDAIVAQVKASEVAHESRVLPSGLERRVSTLASRLCAFLAGVVIVASDHGHVLEHDVEVVEDDRGGDRWRPADGPARLDRIDQFADFDPRQHYSLTLADEELTLVERNARAALDPDDVPLDV